MTASPVLAANQWPTNAALIADVARLGYLRYRSHVLDCTYGQGRWWKLFVPELLTASDLYKLPGVVEFRAGHRVQVSDVPVDYRRMPWPDNTFDAVAFDPPYRLNGRPTPAFDSQYGTDRVMSWQDVHADIRDGLTDCARVARFGAVVLLKCQAQVCSAAVRWQDIEFANHGATLGLDLVDRFDLLGAARKQPERTRADGKPSVQQHAYGRPSTLLVFVKLRPSNPGQEALL